MTTDMITHRATIRALAQHVVTHGYDTMAYALLRAYAAAAGVTQDGGAWVRFPPTGYRVRGWFNFFHSIASSVDADETAFPNRYLIVQAMADARARGEQEAALADDDRPGDLSVRVGELEAKLAKITDGSALIVSSDADLPDLIAADDQMVTRIVRRAAYETGKAMLGVLDGWVEETDMTAPTFSAASIRTMVNDAMLLMDAPPAYRAPKAGA